MRYNVTTTHSTVQMPTLDSPDGLGRFCDEIVSSVIEVKEKFIQQATNRADALQHMLDNHADLIEAGSAARACLAAQFGDQIRATNARIDQLAGAVDEILNAIKTGRYAGIQPVSETAPVVKLPLAHTSEMAKKAEERLLTVSQNANGKSSQYRLKVHVQQINSLICNKVGKQMALCLSKAQKEAADNGQPCKYRDSPLGCLDVAVDLGYHHELYKAVEKNHGY